MKFFLFRKEEVSESSVRSSDTGIGVSVFAIPAEKLSFMTATLGNINITFDQAGIYENTSLIEGDSIEKTSIDIACVEGTEMELMEDILEFTTSLAPKKMVMKFDVVAGRSSFDTAIVDSVESISAKVKSRPTSMKTGEKSKGDKKEEYRSTIADIFFGKNLPSIDYNHEGLAKYGDGVSIDTWSNAGTKGKTHLATKVGNMHCETGADTSGVSTKSAKFIQCQHFTIPNDFTVETDYTIYLVAGGMVKQQAPIFYGDTEGECIGFGGSILPTSEMAAGLPDQVKKGKNVFAARHDGRTGEAAKARTDNTHNGTVSYTWSKYGEFDEDHTKAEGPEVFIIRRDKKFNMYLHNRKGDVIGFIAAKTLKDDPKFDLNTPGLTDGNLLIDQIGSTGSGSGVLTTAATITFHGFVPRFGIIETDIGTASAAQLAQDLYKLYKP